MAFDAQLADRARPLVLGRAGGSEKKMFGGLCFLVNGNMACGVVKDELMVRVGPEAYADALAQPHARPMDFTGRPLKGMVYVSAEGIAQPADLERWVLWGVAYAESQPPKAKKAPAKKRPAKKKTPKSRVRS